MSRFLAIAAFEFRGRLKRLSTWVYFVVFLALAMLWTAAAGGAFVHAHVVFGSGKVWINSPYAISTIMGVLGLASLTVTAAIMGRAVQQDFEYRAENFFFTAPIGKWQYLGGRFVGALLVLLVIYSSFGLGAFFGTFIPGLEADRLGPSRLAAYLAPYASILLPNLVFFGSVFFCAAALTRRMLPVYVGSVLALVGYLAALSLLGDIDNKTLAAMVDPFGLLATSRLVEYWTIADRNARLIPLEGVLAANRALWLAVGALLLALCYWRFRFGNATGGAESKAAAPAEEDGAIALRAPRVDAAPVNGLRLLPVLSWMYFRETVRNVYFGVFVLAGLALLVTAATTMGDLYGTTTWPVTYQVLGLLSGSFGIFMLVIITFYAGELTWRERDNRLDQIHDALPIPTWLPFVAKLLALMLVPVFLQAVLMLCGIAIQTAKGYHHYEVGLYLHGLFGIELVDYWLLCVLAIAVQSIVNQKYLGYFVMIVYYLAMVFANPLGFEHNLYLYNRDIEVTYSDMNGYGHFLPRLRFFQAYYAGWALLLAVAAYLLWTRGTIVGWRERLAVARRRLSLPLMSVAGAGALATAALGGFIFYNTNVLNHFRTEHDRQQLQAEYEKQYRPLLADPQPKLTAVRLNVDIFPQEQRVRVRGTFALANHNAVPVDAVHLLWGEYGERIDIRKLDFGVPATLATDDLTHGVRTYRFATPMAPGATTDMTFDLELATHGFTNTGSNTAVVYNGTFVNGGVLLPEIGYDERGELAIDRDRAKFGLKPKERMRNRDDPAGVAFNAMTHTADFITFEAEVTTDAGQWAIAPGYLVREWVEGDRHHFIYRMDSPILDFFAFQSARYEVRRDHWNDVAIEVYFQPGHEYNLDRMIAAAKASLDYYTANFGPYQYRQFRIIEFPRYASFAQSFPNTVPYSEGIGFIARVRDSDKDDIDYPYYVTAHEMAHQWWGHQVVSADVQGATMLIESMAQYSALMVMKQKYGAAKMQKFLAYELDRYLLGRATEQKKELPLARVENQNYIHYNKGSLVMYALADYIGEDNLNRAIRKFRDRYAFQGPPYPTTVDFLADVRAVTPPQYQYLIEDMFESITLYDNRAVSAEAKPLPGGRYEVTLTVTARKVKADELGKETDVPLADWIDIGVLDADGKPLYLEKTKIDHETETFTRVVDAKPARAGIDPLNKLIDRKPRDNTIAVEIH